ncbi:hypothetical protein [Streptacidiphilus rugosus]|uniref:hypothetical protein n=1 Tax=Streptacidiphilus rugosus TaxID=405783 RepID=UPI00055E1420|nr:hypothetical protein [Streptacidiphilus rugosus]
MADPRRRAARRATATALAVAALLTGCGLGGPQSQTTDRTAVAAALTAVRTGHCPAQPPDLQATDVTGTGDTLEPLVSDRLLLCGYGRPPGAPNGRVLLASAALTDRTTIEGFRVALDGLGKPPGGNWSCPGATGAGVLEIFTDGRREVELDQDLSGCQEVTNGVRDGWVGTSDLASRVLRLMPRSFCAAIWGPKECAFLG